MRQIYSLLNRGSFLSKRFIPYVIIWLIVFITAFFRESAHKGLFYYLIAFGLASTYYLIFYFILKATKVRFYNKHFMLKWIGKLYIPRREIIIHLCIIILSSLLMTFSTPFESAVISQPLDNVILQKIVTEFQRTDIDSITKIDKRYLIKFSDGSKKIYVEKNN